MLQIPWFWTFFKVVSGLLQTTCWYRYDVSCKSRLCLALETVNVQLVEHAFLTQQHDSRAAAALQSYEFFSKSFGLLELVFSLKNG